MKLRIATATLMLLGIGSTFTMRMAVSQTGRHTPMFGGGGAPTPCFPPGIATESGASASTQDVPGCPNGYRSQTTRTLIELPGE